MATMSCRQTLKKMSHKDRVAQWQSTPDCVAPRGALVVLPMSELPELREALEVCLL